MSADGPDPQPDPSPTRGVAAAALQAHTVSRRFGRHWAVRRVSAEFGAGTLSLVVGHNGAGKSTLLRLLAGALRATEGSILVGGEDLSTHPDPASVRARVAWLSHSPFVYGDLTGLENVALTAGLYGRDASDEALLPVLEQVGLEVAASRPAAGYSRGMTQRLGLAQTIVQDAPVWLMDEPHTGLDVRGRELLTELMSQARAAGRCLVVVTHAPERLAHLADATWTLDRGRLVGA